MNGRNDTVGISVIVPMYNCEAYAADLLQSIAGQTFQDFELICVDDGSTDGTLAIVQALCEGDERFRCITKENGGAGSARNVGLDEACGTYVIFLDADDQYSPEMLAELHAAAVDGNADVTICLFDQVDTLLGKRLHDRGIYGALRKQEEPISPDNVPNLFVCTSPNPINKLYRRSFLEDNGLRYTNTWIAQDLTFTFSALPLAKRIACVHKVLATVRTGVDGGSITSGRSKHALEALCAIRNLHAWLEDHGLAQQYEETFLHRCREAFLYETNFAYNEEYLSAIVDMVLQEEPWTRLPYKQRLEYLNLNVATEQAKLEKLQQELDAQETAGMQGDVTEQEAGNAGPTNPNGGETAPDDERVALQRQIASATNRLNSLRYLEEAFASHGRTCR